MEQSSEEKVQRILRRINYYVLLSENKSTGLNDLCEAFHSSLQPSEIFEQLKSDYLHRFLIEENENEITVTVQPDSVSEFELKTIEIVNLWRNDIYEHLKNNVNILPMNLSLITVGCPRPRDLTEPEISMKTVLMTDPKKRFQLNRPPTNLAVMLVSLSTLGREVFFDQWRQLVHTYLLKVTNGSQKTVALTEIGIEVRRPKGVPKVSTLKETLLTDPLNRFKVQQSGTIFVVSLNKKTASSDAQPSGSSAKSQEAKQNDKVSTAPSSESGEWTCVNKIKKGISYAAAASTVSSVMKTNAGGIGSDAAAIATTPTATTRSPSTIFTAFTTPTSLNSDKVTMTPPSPSDLLLPPPTSIASIEKSQSQPQIFHSSKQMFAHSDSKALHQDLLNSVSPSNQNQNNYGYPPVHPYPSPYSFITDSLNTPQKSNSQILAVPDTSSVNLPPSSSASNSFFSLDPPMSRVSHSAASTPISQQSQINSFLEFASQHTFDMRGDISYGSNAGSINNNNLNLIRNASCSVGDNRELGDLSSTSSPLGAVFQGFDGQFTWLHAWLPEVFRGYGPNFVDEVVNKFADEGFVCVEDLLAARESGLLTSDYLRSVANLRLGHFNRLMLSLSNFNAADSGK